MSTATVTNTPVANPVAWDVPPTDEHDEVLRLIIGKVGVVAAIEDMAKVVDLVDQCLEQSAQRFSLSGRPERGVLFARETVPLLARRSVYRERQARLASLGNQGPIEGEPDNAARLVALASRQAEFAADLRDLLAQIRLAAVQRLAQLDRDVADAVYQHSIPFTPPTNPSPWMDRAIDELEPGLAKTRPWRELIDRADQALTRSNSERAQKAHLAIVAAGGLETVAEGIEVALASSAAFLSRGADYLHLRRAEVELRTLKEEAPRYAGEKVLVDISNAKIRQAEKAVKDLEASVTKSAAASIRDLITRAAAGNEAAMIELAGTPGVAPSLADAILDARVSSLVPIGGVITDSWEAVNL